MKEQEKQEDKTKTEKPKKGVNGYLLVLAAFGLFWLGAQFRVPEFAEHKLLVAQEKIDERFQETVILVLRHNLGGAYGVVINQPLEGEASFYNGGPVEPERQIALYTTDITLPQGKVIGNSGLAYVEAGDVDALEKASPQPMWSRVYKGYAGWGRKQLNREINQNRWKVIEYDEKLVLETPDAEKWGAAQAGIAAKDEKEDPKKRKQTM